MKYIHVDGGNVGALGLALRTQRRATSEDGVRRPLLYLHFGPHNLPNHVRFGPSKQREDQIAVRHCILQRWRDVVSDLARGQPRNEPCNGNNGGQER